MKGTADAVRCGRSLQALMGASLLFVGIIGMATDALAEDYPVPSASLCPNVIGSTNKMRYCRNRAISTVNYSTTRAIIVITSSGLDAAGYYEDMVDLATSEGVLDHTDIIVPQFLEEDGFAPNILDTFGLDDGYLYWTGQWRFGRNASNANHTPSYEMIDFIIEKLIEYKPNLEHIVVAGHSAGGQFVTRYSAGSEAEDYANDNGVTMSYLVSSAGSFMYLDSDRFRTVGSDCSSTYNNYAYGVADRDDPNYPYMNAPTVAEFTERLLSRNVYYMVGLLDTDVDTYCSVVAQGLTHISRMRYYRRHLDDICVDWGGPWCPLFPHAQDSNWIEVPNAHHDHNEIFGSAEGLDILFYLD